MSVLLNHEEKEERKKEKEKRTADGQPERPSSMRGTRKRAARLRGRGMCPAGTRASMQQMYPRHSRNNPLH
jgi:hypothetical protein